MGVSYRDNSDHNPYFFYVWRDGVELTAADESAVYRVEEKAELDDMMAGIQQEMHELALRMRPEEQQVWSGVAWLGKVFDPSGHEVPPVMKRADSVVDGDIVCEEFRTEYNTSHAFVVVEDQTTSARGFTRIRYVGMSEVALHSADKMLTTFRRSDTGPYFNNVVSTCEVCGGDGVEPYVKVTRGKRFERTYNPTIKGIVTTEFAVTTYTATDRPCTNCLGLGAFPNWALGN